MAFLSPLLSARRAAPEVASSPLANAFPSYVGLRPAGELHATRSGRRALRVAVAAPAATFHVAAEAAPSPAVSPAPPAPAPTPISPAAAPPAPTGGAGPFSGLLSLKTEDAIERAKKGSPIEKLKAEKDGLSLKYEISELAKKPLEEIEANDIDHRLKWIGVWNRFKRTPGKFMMRLKVPNGILNSEQMRFLASVIAQYPEEFGVADITTRQNIQLRGIELPHVPEIVDGLRKLGLTSYQSGMDNVRNMVGSPIAGIDAEEMYDTRKLCKDIQDMITAGGEGNPEFTNLPRKFNICVSGGRDDYAHTDINDVGLRPCPDADGRMGFNVVLGGFMGSFRIAESLPMDAWVPEEDAVAFCRAVLEVFRENGNRKNRNKARLMWLIEEWGMPRFRAEVEAAMGKALEAAKALPEADKPWVRRHNLLGVHEQKQTGLHWVGLSVPVGRMLPWEMAEVARLADEFGSGEIRLTVEQNILIPNVPTGKVAAILADKFVEERFKIAPGPLVRNLVSCTGMQFCGFGLIETKNRSLEIARELEAELEIPGDVRMHWTGCPNTCGQAQLADIGIIGSTSAKRDGAKVEGANVIVDGKVGEGAEFGTMYKEGVPADELKAVIREILVTRHGATPRA
eukprot:tig00020941_g16234.t1